VSDEWMIGNVFECVNMRECKCCTVSEQINEMLNFHFMCHRYKEPHVPYLLCNMPIFPAF